MFVYCPTVLFTNALPYQLLIEPVAVLGDQPPGRALLPACRSAGCFCQAGGGMASGERRKGTAERRRKEAAAGKQAAARPPLARAAPQENPASPDAQPGWPDVKPGWPEAGRIRAGCPDHGLGQDAPATGIAAFQAANPLPAKLPRPLAWAKGWPAVGGREVGAARPARPAGATPGGRGLNGHSVRRFVLLLDFGGSSSPGSTWRSCG